MAKDERREVGAAGWIGGIGRVIATPVASVLMFLPRLPGKVMARPDPDRK